MLPSVHPESKTEATQCPSAPCVPHWAMQLELKEAIIFKWDGFFLNYFHLSEVVKWSWTEQAENQFESSQSSLSLCFLVEVTWKNVNILVTTSQWSRQGGKFLKKTRRKPLDFLVKGYCWLVCQTLKMNIKMGIPLTRLGWGVGTSILVSFQLGLFSCNQQCASVVSRTVLGCLQGSLWICMPDVVLACKVLQWEN